MAEAEDISAALRNQARLLLEDVVNNDDRAIDERVLAWVKLKSWCQGTEFACCRIKDLAAPRANVIQYPVYSKEQLAKIQEELVVASYQQCADYLVVSASRVRAAAARLVERGLLETPIMQSRVLVTKHKLGVGFRAHLSHTWVRAFRPVFTR